MKNEEKNDEFMSSVSKSIADKGVLYKLKISKPSFKAKMSFQELGILDISQVATPSAMRLIDKSKLAPFDTISNRMRNYLNENSHEGIGGLRFVPWNKFKEVKTQLESQIQEWDEQLESFASDYEHNLELSVSEWRNVAGQIWDESPILKAGMSKEGYVNRTEQKVRRYWPNKDELKKKFGVTQSCVQFSDSIKGETSPSFISEAQDLANEEIKTFVKDAMFLLRRRTMELCTHVRDVMLNSGTIKENSLDSLRNWIKQFKELNFLDDKECEAYIEDLEGFVSGDASSLKDDKDAMDAFSDLLDSSTAMGEEILSEAVIEQLEELHTKQTRKLNI